MKAGVWGALAAPAPSAILVLAKLAASALVLLGGFRAVSDDDFSRVVIAEEWARAPRLDASQTSWLPFPFWVVGTAMKIAGRSLDTARATALVLGVCATLVVYVAARWLGETRGAATVGALAAAVFPWSARLGVATVPELPTAALTVLAMTALVPSGDTGRRRLLGGSALFVATLSRYEAWPVALVFALVCMADARRSPEAGRALLGGGLLALAGPLSWMAWNLGTHHDALHFLARVTAYRQALGGADGSAFARVLGYPVSMLREAPEVVALLALGASITAMQGGRVLRARLAPYARPAALAALQIAALSAAMIKDGAPTHHPERAVLTAMLLGAVLGGALVAQALASIPPTRRALAAVAIAGVAMGAAALGRSGSSAGAFAQREDEEAIGRAAASLSRPGDPVLVEVVDYGYLAVQAALGRPEDAVPDRSVDPRRAKSPSSFADVAALRARLTATEARWAAARLEEPARAVMGAPVASRGSWGLFRVEGSR